jgi:tetratricopeptide (TPR) repeat protein
MLQHVVATKGKNHMNVAYAHMQVGNRYRRLKKWVPALEHLHQAKEVIESHPDMPITRAVYVREDIAAIRIEEGKADDALKLYREALAMAESAKEPDATLVAELQFSVVKTRYLVGEQKEAVAAAEELALAAESANMPELSKTIQEWLDAL